MDPKEFIKSQKGVERRHETEHGVFIIRDRWVLDASRQCGYRLDTCQYATKDELGDIIWTNCPEGVDFASIRPFEAASNLPRFSSSTPSSIQSVEYTPEASEELLWLPTLGLRFVRRGGERVLQQKYGTLFYRGDAQYEWRDVPIVDEA